MVIQLKCDENAAVPSLETFEEAPSNTYVSSIHFDLLDLQGIQYETSNSLYFNCRADKARIKRKF